MESGLGLDIKPQDILTTDGDVSATSQIKYPNIYYDDMSIENQICCDR